MSKRHSDALAIQMGAVNLSGMAHSLIEACREVREEGGDTRADPAVRLIVHQMAFIARVAELDDALSAYGEATRACEDAIKVREPAAS